MKDYRKNADECVCSELRTLPTLEMTLNHLLTNVMTNTNVSFEEVEKILFLLSLKLLNRFSLLSSPDFEQLGKTSQPKELQMILLLNLMKLRQDSTWQP